MSYVLITSRVRVSSGSHSDMLLWEQVIPNDLRLSTNSSASLYNIKINNNNNNSLNKLLLIFQSE